MHRLVLLISLISTISYGQSTNLLSNLDSTFKPGNAIIENHDYISFFESKQGDVEINLEKLDQQLLNAALHFSINRLRISKNKNELNYDPNLEFLAYTGATFIPLQNLRG